MQANYGLAILMNSCIKIITSPIYKSLSRNMSFILTYISIVKDPNLRNKEFFDLYQFLIKDD